MTTMFAIATTTPEVPTPLSDESRDGPPSAPRQALVRFPPRPVGTHWLATELDRSEVLELVDVRVGRSVELSGAYRASPGLFPCSSTGSRSSPAAAGRNAG